VSRFVSSCFIIAAICLASVANAQDVDNYQALEALGLGPTLKTENQPTGVFVTVGSGVGSFQDIQVPMNRRTGVRADGTTDAAENLTHMGLPIYGSLGFETNAGGSWRWRVFELTGIKMGAANGAAGTADATYSRLDLSSAMVRTAGFGHYKLTSTGQIELRRTGFNNTSESHFINAALVAGRMRLSRSNYSWEIRGEYAPIAHFGFSPRGFFGGRFFPGSSAELGGGGTTALVPLQRGVWLEMGADTEIARVSIADVSEYRGYGLAARNLDNSSRSYKLVTNTLHLGFRKEF
jgi:hypothetical protein